MPLSALTPSDAVFPHTLSDDRYIEMNGLLKGERLIVTRGIVHDGGTEADSNYA